MQRLLPPRFSPLSYGLVVIRGFSGIGTVGVRLGGTHGRELAGVDHSDALVVIFCFLLVVDGDEVFFSVTVSWLLLIVGTRSRPSARFSSAFIPLKILSLSVVP